MSINLMDVEDAGIIMDSEDVSTFKESSPANRLERRRLIEEIFEEKRLRAELSDFEEL